jgi:hypothetical protein
MEDEGMKNDDDEVLCLRFAGGDDTRASHFDHLKTLFKL